MCVLNVSEPIDMTALRSNSMRGEAEGFIEA